MSLLESDKPGPGGGQYTSQTGSSCLASLKIATKIWVTAGYDGQIPGQAGRNKMVACVQQYMYSGETGRDTDRTPERAH